MYYYSIILVNLFICIIHDVKSQSHAFIQLDNELRYLVDGVAIPMRDIVDIGDAEQRHDTLYDETLLKNLLVFDPPFLDFKEHPIGMPKMRKVHVHNTSPDTSIHLHSLSGNTMHFHCTFFQDKIIGPGQNTSYDVVYLGREEGFIENTIYIHTSVGTYRYWVKAIGTSNPYRIRPLIGLKMPLNSSYTPVIQVHNPHSHNLQIVEMYSTGGDLHLELPEGVTEGERDHWNIPGHHTKSIMRATFVARRENNHTAYIRIVPGDPVSDFMVIPVEVEVSSEQGLFFPSDSLYFGVLTRHDPPVSLPLFLLNSAHKHIHIQNIITSAVNEAISIDFKPIKIAPGAVHPVQVATVTFDPAKAIPGVKVSGKLIVKSKISAYKLSVPFCVDMHQGSLSYDQSATTFYSGGLTALDEEASRIADSTEVSDDGPSEMSLMTPVGPDGQRTHDLILKNSFRFPVVVYNISLSDAAAPHFKVKWTEPVIMPADTETSIATLTISSEDENLRLPFNMSVHTNVTSIQIPLVVYNGKLTKYVPTPMMDKWLDFGTLGMGEQSNVYFYLLNENPVQIRLQSWGSSVSHSAVELMGIDQGQLPTCDHPPNKADLSQGMFVKANEYAVFRIGVLTPNSEGVLVAEAHVQTQFERVTIPFRVRTADGLLSISPNPLMLEQAFPSKISSQQIDVLSTFGHVMTVDGVSPLVADSRFEYVTPNTSQSPPVIRPSFESNIGLLQFDPKTHCADQCYCGFHFNSKDGQQWTNTFSQSVSQSETDSQLFTTLYERYEQVSPRSFNTSLTLDTSEVQGHRFHAKVSMVWPRLAQAKLEFPLTNVFNMSVKDVVIENPSSEPVAAQLLFLHQYSGYKSVIGSLAQRFDLGGRWTSIDDEMIADNFVLIDAQHVDTCYGGNDTHLRHVCFAQPPPDAHLSHLLAQHRRHFERHTKSSPPKDSIVLFLKPLEKVRIRVGYMPTNQKTDETLLLIRNNLTAVEAIVVHGTGGRGHLSFDKSAYKWNYVQFHVLSSFIKNCSLITHPSQEMFPLYKWLAVKNSGNLPIDIVDVRIGETSCRDFGFSLANCTGFRLMPNESRNVQVSFRPDFSLFYITQTLTIHTTFSHLLAYNNSEEALAEGHTLKVKLIGTVASNIVNTCGVLVARPTWEPIVYCSVMILLSIMALGTVLRGYLEGHYHLGKGFLPTLTLIPTTQPPQQFDKAKVFDLHAIGTWSPQESEKAKDETNNNSLPSKPPKPEAKKILHNSYYDKPKIMKVYQKSARPSSVRDHEPVTVTKKTRNHTALSLSSLFPASTTPDLSPTKATTDTDHVTSKRAMSSSQASSTTESSSVDEICPVKEDIYEPLEKPVRRKNKPLDRTLSDDCLLVKCEPVVPHKTLLQEPIKTKKVKKIKQDMNKKNSLELPYTLKHNKVRESNHDYCYKNPNRVRTKTHAHLEKSNCGATMLKHSSHSLFMNPDTPKPVAKAVVAPRMHNQPLAPRDPSYSAVVLGNTQPKTKPTPVGKIVPEVKHVNRCVGGLGVIGQKPAHVTGPQSFSALPQSNQQDQSAYNLYLRNCSSHIGHPNHLASQSRNQSWGETPSFSSPPHLQALQGLPRLPYQPNNTLNEDDWLPFDRPNQHFQWNENEAACQSRDTPPPSLWESLSTFSIWSSPYESSLLQSNHSYATNSLWQDSASNSMASNLAPSNMASNLAPSNRDQRDPIRNRFDHYRSSDGMN